MRQQHPTQDLFSRMLLSLCLTLVCLTPWVHSAPHEEPKPASKQRVAAKAPPQSAAGDDHLAQEMAALILSMRQAHFKDSSVTFPDGPRTLKPDQADLLMALVNGLNRRLNFITDQGNHILDIKGLNIANPEDLEKKINLIPGVLDNGIFANCKPNKVIVGGG